MPTHSHHRNSLPALLLSAVGGFTDGVGYLTLYRLFISHMSGNSTMLGIFAAEANQAEVIHRIVPILTFVAGVFLATIASLILTDRGRGSGVSILLAVESVLLATFAILAYPLIVGVRIESSSLGYYYFLVSLPALAMGIQNATIRKVGNTGIRTTFVSGTLTTLAEDVANAAFWLGKQSRRGRSRRSLGLHLRLFARNPNAQRALVLGAVWLCYFGGALGGAFLMINAGIGAMAIPVVCLLGLALYLALAKQAH